MGQRVAHDLEDLLDREFHVLRRQVALLGGDELDELRLGHAALAVHSCLPAVVSCAAHRQARRRVTGTRRRTGGY